MCVGGYVADLIQNLAMLDPILGGDRPDERRVPGSPRTSSSRLTT